MKIALIRKTENNTPSQLFHINKKDLLKQDR